MGLSKVCVVLEDDGTYTLYNSSDGNCYLTIISGIKDKDTALLVKKAYIDGKYDGRDEYMSHLEKKKGSDKSE